MSEAFSYWRYANDQIWDSYENCRPFKDMAQAASSEASLHQMPAEQYRVALGKLYESYSAFLHGTNEGSDSDKWRHWYNHFRLARLTKKLGKPYLAQEMLSDAASTYLHGSLRVPRMDRALLDSLIAQETFAYIDRAGVGAISTQFGCWAVCIIPVIVWQLFTGEQLHLEKLLLVAAVILAAVALLYLWPRRGVLKLHRAMRDTYQLLSGSVVSVPELRRAVERARDQGVVWPPELFAVLDDVEARTRVL